MKLRVTLKIDNLTKTDRAAPKKRKREIDWLKKSLLIAGRWSVEQDGYRMSLEVLLR